MTMSVSALPPIGAQRSASSHPEDESATSVISAPTRDVRI
jgi:hypothetical protein